MGAVYLVKLWLNVFGNTQEHHQTPCMWSQITQIFLQKVLTLIFEGS